MPELQVRTDASIMIIIPYISLSFFSGFFDFCVASAEDDVPERRTHPEACLFSSEMMLVVVLLETMEVAPFGF